MTSTVIAILGLISFLALCLIIQVNAYNNKLKRIERHKQNGNISQDIVV